MITDKELKEILNYDPDSGVFIRKKNSGGILAGTIAGSVHAGYRQISVNGKKYYAHRLAWLYMTGDMPTFEIDHINGDKDDNRWANLREASHTNNVMNIGLRSDNSSGYKGVSKKRNSWQARIWLDGKQTVIGCFPTKEEAARAYDKLALEHYGEYARLNFKD